MIVIGADPHKSTHTVSAVDALSGELQSSETVSARKAGHVQLLRWGRALGEGRVWAIEDCRHVSGNLERFLVARSERVAPKLMAGARRSARERGKSDEIDSLAVARAALREGIERLPAAHLDEQALDIKLLADHREDLVSQRTDDQRRLRWHLHDLWPELEIPAGALDRDRWLEKVARKLARAEQSVKVRVSRELLRAIRERTRRERELAREITLLVRAKAPQLLELPGCGALTAAKLVSETAGFERFSSEAKFARLAGVAPIPVSSGRSDRHRLDRGGNRQLNCALHRVAVTQGRVHPPARAFLVRKEAEGRTRMEALRSLKRHLARTIWKTMTIPETPTFQPPATSPVLT